MANISSLVVDITTGSGQDNTDGDVYLGIAGREFYLDTADDNFKEGHRERFIFGSGSNVRQPLSNDPRTPQLTMGEAEGNDVYVRFAPDSRTDAWPLRRAEVHVNDGTFRGRSIYWASLWFEGQIVMSTHSTQVLNLGKFFTSPAAVTVQTEADSAD